MAALGRGAPVIERWDMMILPNRSPMSSGPDKLPPGASEQGSDGRLDSWKEIAAYLRRSVRSARRWEKEEGLPVHRHVHRKGDSVYGFKPELDAWWNDRGANLRDPNGAEETTLPSVVPTTPELEPGLEESKLAKGSALPDPQSPRRAAWIVAGFAVALMLVGAVAWLSRNGSASAAGSLTPLPFQARDWVLVADFENRTGEKLLDGTLDYALGRELSNSRFVNVVPRQRVGDALRLMRRPPDSPISAGVGREVCLRDGEIRALLTGRVEKLASKYVLSVEIVEPKQGTTLAGFREESTGLGASLAAMQRISDRVRVALRETPSPDGSDRQLAKVTTPSLRALQLYSQADSLIDKGNSAAAEELLRQAVAEDPTFASAWIHLAWTVANQERPVAEVQPYAETALRLAETTTERERYFIRGSYYHLIGQPEEAIAAYEALVSLYPDHFWATNNLIDLYLNSGRNKDAAQCAVRRADLRPKDFEAKFWAAWYLAQFEPDLARASFYVRRTRELDSPDVMREFPSEVSWLELFPAYERWLEGDSAGALALATRFAEKLESTPSLRRDGAVQQLGNLFLTLGRLRTAEELFRRLSDPTLELTGLSLLRGNHRELKRLSSALVAQSYDVPLNIGILLARSGLTDQAGRVVAANKESGSPLLSGTLQAARGELAMARGHTGEAIHQLRESQKRTRVFGRAAFLLGTQTLATALARQGDLEGAIRALERGSTHKKQVAFHWVSTGVLWERNQLLLARLYRQAGRAADAQRIEADLLNLLALADADHPIVVELRRLRGASTLATNALARPIR